MIFGRILLDNEHYRVAIGLFGLSMRVYLKNRDLNYRVSQQERRYFHSLVENLQLAGVKIEPDSTALETVLTSFAEAVILRGGPRWGAFFTTYTPEEHARVLLQDNHD